MINDNNIIASYARQSHWYHYNNPRFYLFENHGRGIKIRGTLQRNKERAVRWFSFFFIIISDR